jgi:hypothetical protein
MFFDGMGNVLFCGKPRTGKTYGGVLCALTDEQSEGVVVVGKTGLSQARADRLRSAFGMPVVPVAVVAEPHALLDDKYRGWTWFVDEMQQFFPSRRPVGKSLDDLQIFYEYGKRSARIVGTTQMIRNVDLIASGFMDTTLRACGIEAKPLAGILNGADWPKPMMREWNPLLPMRCSFRDKFWLDSVMFSGAKVFFEYVDSELMRKQTTLQNELAEYDVAGDDKFAVPFSQWVADAFDSGQLVR